MGALSRKISKIISNICFLVSSKGRSRESTIDWMLVLFEDVR